MKKSLKQATVEQDACLVWNTFIEMIALAEYEDLSSLQRKAHLVFWYESEVQNGGHGQYFENRGLERVPETIEALVDLGARGQANVLSMAAELFAASPPGSAWEDMLCDDDIDTLDNAFHDCSPNLVEVLQHHLVEHQEEYIELT